MITRSIHNPVTKAQNTNHVLSFSTVTAILDWVASDPHLPSDELVHHFELLRADIDIKINAIKKRRDFTGKMGLKDPR